MASRRLDYLIDVDSSGAVSGVKSFSKVVSQELAKVEGDFEDTATAGEKVAAVMAKMATDLDQELDRAAQAADALKTALGEDLAGRADIGSIIGDLQRMGLTFEDITTDADKLAGALKQMDEVQMKGLNAGLGGVNTKMGDLGKSAGSSRSVLANLVGNTTQDLGALTGIAGSAGVAIGQMGEYIADAAGEGEKLTKVIGNFSKIGVPIAAVSVATSAIASHFEGIRKANEENAKQARDFAAALNEGATAAEAVEAALVEAGKVEFTTKGGDVFDVTERLAELGLTVEQFSTLVAGGTPAINKWGDAMRAAGADGDAVKEVMVAAGTQAENLADAQRLAAINAKVFGDAADKAAGSVDRLAEANRNVSDPQIARNTQEHADMMLLEARQAQDTAANMEALRKKLELKQAADERAKQAVQDHIDALQEEADLALETSGAMQSMADINREIADQQREVNKLAKDEKATVDDRVDAAIRLAELQEQQFDTLKKAAGATATATEKLDAQNRALLGQAATLEGRARAALIQYIGDLNGIPAEKRTEIEALIDQGKFDEAERKVQRLSENRKATVTFDADTKEADDARERLAEPITTDMLIFPRVGGPIPRFAGGGRVPRSTIALVGERGPEVVGLPGGSRVYSASQTSQMLSSSSGSAAKPTQVVNVYQTFNAAAMGAPFDIMNEVQKANKAILRLLPRNS